MLDQMTDDTRGALPDDIEQKLLDGQRLRATYDLIERRQITANEARILVGKWLHQRQQSGPSKASDAC
jgi:hypothetical protein